MASPEIDAPEVRKADPAARRNALLLILIGAAVGSSLIVAFERYRGAVQEWLVADPAEVSQRLQLTLVFGGVALLLPLLIAAASLWRLGVRTIRSGQFPPPNIKVVRDTPVAQGGAATWRGRALQMLAIALALAALLLCLLLWRMAAMINATV